MKPTILCLSLLMALPLLRAQPVVAPSPGRTGASKGEDIGSYNVTNTFEFGYRFAAVGGDSGLYRSMQNYGNGLRLFGGNFTANSKDGHGLLFDSMSLNTQGIAGDPYGVATLRIEKNELYRYDLTWRRSDYFNPALLNGESDTLKNTQRVMQDHDLAIKLAKWAKLDLGYSRNHETGPEISSYELYIGGLARSVLPIDKDARRDWNEYRVGTQLDFLGFRLTLTRRWDFYKDDTSVASLVPGQTYPLANLLNQPLQPALPVTYPSIATAYDRSQPMHIRTPGWSGNLNRNAKYWAINARITYNKGDQNSIYYETESGAAVAANAACSNCGIGKPATATTFMPGNGRSPFTAGDLTLSLFPTSRLTIVNSTSAQGWQFDGTGQMLQVNTSAATKNIFWNYRMGSGRISDALDANYRATKWLGLHAEYRYTDRWIDNNLIRTGTTNSKDLNAFDDHLNTGTLGFRLKPVKPLSINLDATVGRDNHPETPVSPAHFHNIKARVDYRPNKRLRFGATYRQMYNLSAPSPVVFTSTYGVPPAPYYASHSRDLSATSSIEVSRNLSLDFSYTKLHLDSIANLWAELPLADSATIVSVPGYVSRYISNIHTVSLGVRTSIKRGTFYAGYNITRDTGDGRGVQNLGLQDPAAAYLALANTFPMTYQAPMARVSIKITPKLQWNGGWEFYRYNQKFAYFGYQPYYRAQTGYTSLSCTF